MRFVPFLLAALAVLAFVVFACGDVLSTSPTTDEVVHLSAGYTYLQTGDYRLNPEHPPLLKKLAALPLLGMQVWTADEELQRQWDAATTEVMAEWYYAHQLFFGRKPAYAATPTSVVIPRSAFVNDTETMFRRARLTMLLTGVLLAVAVFCWAWELWGAWGAALSTLLFALDPNFIAHSGLVTTDVGVTMLMFVAVYFFWRTSQRFSIPNITVFALAFALALTAKFSAVVLIPVVVAIVVWRRQWRLLIPIAIAAVVSFIAIWAAYGFRFAASPGHELAIRQPVEEWYATQSLLPMYPDGPPDSEVRAARATTRIGFLGNAILRAREWHLLPESYLYGFAVMRRSSIVRDSFLRGQFSNTGFRDYFFWTFVYKTAIGAIVAIALALWTARRTKSKALPFLLWPVVLYLGVSVMTNLNIGHRHLLPIYPFLYVLCGGLAVTWKRRPAIAFAVLAIALLAQDIAKWGRHLSFMNVPRGYEQLVDSNYDWGQDLPRLAAWLKEHKVTEPIALVFASSADPRYYGIAYENYLFGYPYEPEAPVATLRGPGYLAINVSRLQGLGIVPNERNTWKDALAQHGAREVGRGGDSILIYRLAR